MNFRYTGLPSMELELFDSKYHRNTTLAKQDEWGVIRALNHVYQQLNHH
jgi:hypothetical protein